MKTLPLLAIVLLAASYAHAAKPADVKAVNPATSSTTQATPGAETPTVVAPAATPVASPVATPAQASQATQTTTPLTGSVSAVVDMANPKTMLSAAQIEGTVPNDLLKKKCHVVTIKLTNNTPEYLEVLQAEVINALDANTVAAEEVQASQRRRAIGSGLLRMAASAIPYAGYGSTAAWHAVNAGSNVAYHTANMVSSTGPDSPGTVAGLQQRINNLLVNPKDSVQFQTLVAKSSPAQLRVTFKNLKTNEIFSYQTAN
jgi:hypothetical protein